MLKKLFAIIMLTCSFAFAENYIVLSVEGKAEYLKDGVWTQIVKNDVLIESNEVNVGLNSSVVLINNGKNFTIKSLSKGKLIDCIGKNYN